MENRTVRNGSSAEDFLTSYKKHISDNSEISVKSNVDNRYCRHRTFSREEIERIVASGSLDERIKLSNHYYLTKGIYRRILLYYATILKYNGLLIPNSNCGTKLSKFLSQFSNKYFKAQKYIDTVVPLYNFCVNCAILALKNGCYYGLVVEATTESFVTLDLDYKYCRTRYRAADGTDILEFNLQYFSRIVDEDDRKTELEAYPTFIRKAYKKYEKGLIDGWLLIPSQIGICFPFYDGFPAFLDTIIATEDYEDAKETEKERSEQGIHKILIQEMPHLNDGQLLFEPPEVKVMHDGAVKMMSKEKHMSVLTSYGNVKVEGTRQLEADNNSVNIAFNNIFSDAGVSKEMFVSDSNLTLEMSIRNDVYLMMPFAEKISCFFTKLINTLFGNSLTSFTFTILPASTYLEEKQLKSSMTLANAGYSFLYPAAIMGISPTQLVNLKRLENESLKLDDLLIPLSNAYTQSTSGDASTANEGNKNAEKEVIEKSPKTQQNQEAQ